MVYLVRGEFDGLVKVGKGLFKEFAADEQLGDARPQIGIAREFPGELLQQILGLVKALFFDEQLACSQPPFDALFLVGRHVLG